MVSLSIFLPLSLTHFHRHHLCTHKQKCSILCIASFIQFCKCTWAFTVMLNVSVGGSNCPAWVMINKRKLCSAEIVRRVGPRQWLWWMQQQLVWHRRWDEEEENNVEEGLQPGTSAGEVSNWGRQLEGALFSIHLLEPQSTNAAHFSLCQFYITQALHPSSGGTNKPVLLTVLGLVRERTILIFPLTEVTMYDMLLILAVTVQMGHDIRNSLKG